MISVEQFVTVLIRKTVGKRLRCEDGAPKWAKGTKGAVQNGPLACGQKILFLSKKKNN